MNNRSNIWYFEDVDLYNVLCPHKVPHMKEKHIFHHFMKNDRGPNIETRKSSEGDISYADFFISKQLLIYCVFN